MGNQAMVATLNVLFPFLKIYSIFTALRELKEMETQPTNAGLISLKAGAHEFVFSRVISTLYSALYAKSAQQGLPPFFLFVWK